MELAPVIRLQRRGIRSIFIKVHSKKLRPVFRRVLFGAPDPSNLRSAGRRSSRWRERAGRECPNHARWQSTSADSDKRGGPENHPSTGGKHEPAQSLVDHYSAQSKMTS